MGDMLQNALWNQFGASIDMLINVVSNCPEDYFEQNPRFYYIAYHSALFLDYYLTIPPGDFSPLLPFTQKEKNDRPKESIDDLIPDRMYTRLKLIDYLKKSRVKCRNLISSLSTETLNQRFVEGDNPGDMDYPVLEILLYNLRHTQHHTAQLNLLIRQDFDRHMEWSFRAGDMETAGFYSLNET